MKKGTKKKVAAPKAADQKPVMPDGLAEMVNKGQAMAAQAMLVDAGFSEQAAQKLIFKMQKEGC